MTLDYIIIVQGGLLMKKRKNVSVILVTVFCMIVLFMGVGYASFQEISTVNGTVNNGSVWNVHFDNIEATVPDGSLAINHQAQLDATKNTALIDVSLSQPSDEISYTLTVVNEGNIDAVVDSIEVAEASDEEVETRVSPISYAVDGLSSGAIIPAGSKATFTVTATYHQTDETVITNERKNVSVVVHYDLRTK